MNDTQFYLYAGLLTISGILLLLLAATGFGQSVGSRIVNALFGLGFTGYGGYLLLAFDGDAVTIFYYAFIVPIIAVVHAVKAFAASRTEPAQPPYPAQPGHQPYPAQPGHQPYPGQPGQQPYPGQPGQQPYPGQPGQPAR